MSRGQPLNQWHLPWLFQDSQKLLDHQCVVRQGPVGTILFATETARLAIDESLDEAAALIAPAS
jgi:hypothetical protein